MPVHLYLWHPILVHFTAGLLSTSLLFFVIAWRVASDPWRSRLLTVAEWNLWFGTAVTVLTVAVGFIAFGTAPHEEAMVPLMEGHRDFALYTFAAFIAMAAISAWLRGKPGHPSPLFLAGLLVACILLVLTAGRGGDLVFEHGVGVSNPSVRQAHGG